MARRPGARVGIRDVARAAAVSTATVSNALNGTGRVDPRTRERVVQVAQRLGYRANPSAQRLRRSRSGVLAVTAREPQADGYGLMDVEYFVEVLMSAASLTLAEGYSLTMVPASTASVTLAGIAVDGVLVFDVLRADPLLAALTDAGTPVVTVGRDTSVSRTAGWWVDNDMVTGTTALLDHLAGAGARRIALLTGPADYSYCVDAEAAYRAWAAARGQQPLVAHVEHEPGHHAVGELLDLAEPPDAICAVLERYALAALAAAEHRGLRVPADLRVAAGSDSGAARHAPVPVTALDLQPREVGRQAARLLIDRLDAVGDDPVQHLVDASLLPRASTAP